MRLVPTSIPQPEMFVCMPAEAAEDWMLRLRLWRSDPRERTGGLTAMKTVCKYNIDKEIQGKLLLAREARDPCHGVYKKKGKPPKDPLTP